MADRLSLKLITTRYVNIRVPFQFGFLSAQYINHGNMTELAKMKYSQTQGGCSP